MTNEIEHLSLMKDLAKLISHLGLKEDEWFLGGPWCFILNDYQILVRKKSINVQVKESVISNWFKDKKATCYASINLVSDKDWVRFFNKTGFAVDFIPIPDAFFTTEHLKRNTVLLYLKNNIYIRSSTPSAHLAFVNKTSSLLKNGFNDAGKTQRCMDEAEQVYYLAVKKQNTQIQKLSSRLIRTCFLILTSKDENSVNNDVNGQIACSGVVSGPALVVVNSEEVTENLEDNSILITKMISPSCYPMLNKIKAIVTDEGGQLCHAAILSREQGIPCIVGTGVATQKFKTGEIVTVDAKNGVVYKNV